MVRIIKVIIFITMIVINTSLLYSQETIIDSVFSNSQLDGTIFFRESTQQFEINTLGAEMFIGDYGMGINPDPNSRSRGYISFDLPEIPEGYSVDSVFIRMKQYHSYANNEPGVYPIWDVADGDTMFCIMDHIDYGNSLDSEDWTAGDIGDLQTLHTNIGVISDSAENGFRYLDITEYVLNDYNYNRARSQYRVRFPIETDWDYWNDKIMFGEGADYTGAPKIYIYFNENNGIAENMLMSVHQLLKAYPNPFNPTTTIDFSIPSDSEINLSIYNIKGQKVKTLANEQLERGNHSVVWHGKDKYGKAVGSGVYFYKLKVNGKNEAIKKCLMLK